MGASVSTMGLDDIDFVNQEPVLPKAKKAKKEKDTEARPYLRIFETLPAQLLNSYGEASYVNSTDAEVWAEFSKPQKTGAMYMTEMCSKDPERRGVGINRSIEAVLRYAKYQQKPDTKLRNAAIMKAEVLENFDAEITRMIPSLAYCLAEKKKQGIVWCGGPSWPFVAG